MAKARLGIAPLQGAPDVMVTYHLEEVEAGHSRYQRGSVSLNQMREIWGEEFTVIDLAGNQHTFSLAQWANADPEKTRLVLWQHVYSPRGKEYIDGLFAKARTEAITRGDVVPGTENE